MSRSAEEPAPDPVVEVYKKDLDQTLFDRTLALTPEERIRQLQALVRFQWELEQAGRALHDDARTS